ncbi:MAG: calcium-binding protein, partial [Chromatium okenii]|nr:calcium-binding protein [Chromatium okenii]
ADLIKGDGGDDHLYGGFADKPDTYNDMLYGGAGDDHYHYLSAGDQIIEEKGEGTDTVYSSVSYTLASNFENLVLTGNAWVIGIGNELNNVLTGNGAGSLLMGETGNDTYYVGVGDKLDELPNEGIDTVCSDITYVLLLNFENLTLTGKAAINGTGNSLNNILTGNSGKNELTGLAGNDTYYVSLGDTIKELPNEGIDTVYSDITHVLSANVENLTLTGFMPWYATGNALNNVLTGNSGANTLIGLAGNDVYYVQNTTDKVTEAVNSGIDTVYSSVDFTLSSNVENLTLIGEDDPATEVIEGNINGTGNDLNNTLTGNKGKNTLTGLAGDDVYYVDVKDTVIEGKDAGTDAIFYNGSD